MASVVEHIFNIVPSAMLIVSADGEIRNVNAKAMGLLGLPREEILNERVERFLAPISELLAAIADASARPTIEVRTPAGFRTYGFNVSEVEPGGTCAITFQDITEVLELRAQNDRLIQLAAVGEVLPAVLHEVKNPLAAVTTALEVAIEGVEESPLQEELHVILTEVRRIRLTLDGVGTVGRPLRFEHYSAIDHACRDALNLLASRAREKGVTLEDHVCHLPLLHFDPAVARAIVFNLVVNSLYATSEGDTITLSVSLTEDNSTLEISVIDSGSGMTEEVRERCTELFFSTRPRGSGIGLALCRSAAERASGTIHVSSTLDEGTEVCLRVPLVAPQQERELCHALRN